MGSQADAQRLPDASSPSLVLTHPTDEERRRTWALTHPKWGLSLSLDDYLAREAYLTTAPLAKDGGVTHWILTDSSLPPNERPILSSCECVRKHALLSRPPADGHSASSVVDGVSHGIGSVFTDPQYRGRGYASRMMKDLGARLRNWQVSGNDDKPALANVGPQTLFSVLYSDIGKGFYAKNGWVPFPSAHVSLPPAAAAAAPSSSGSNTEELTATPITEDDLAELCRTDEQLVRAAMAQRAQASGKACVAIVPSKDAMLWHLVRQEFMTERILGRTPAVHGGVAGARGKRAWAVWTRSYYSPPASPAAANTLYVLRFVLEDPGADAAYLREAVRAVLRLAQAEAAEWKVQHVHMWNPTGQLRDLIEKSGLPHEFVERETDSIASLQWYGDEPLDLEWVLNEKFAWC